MVAAALVAGNTVLLKSAEQTPLTAQRLVELFERVGLPANVLIHLPGRGETVGAALVESPEIAQVAFTGSQAVGLEIAKKCAGRIYHNRRENLHYPVKVVAEMGGKNGIIVTANADLDEAVSGVLYSAYGHAGQKCSACSRVVVDERVAKRFLQRFAPASRDIAVGKAYWPETVANPLITREERQRLLSLELEILREAQEHSGKVHVNRLREPLPGNCVGPLVVELPAARAFAPESFLQRELFAPVVHVVSYRNLRQALDIFNATPFALTGGLYSQSQDEIDFASSRMECGNIYVNRPNTGARVGIEPFGGFKLSGTGPKAGSTDYVGAFMVSPGASLLSVSASPSPSPAPSSLPASSPPLAEGGGEGLPPLAVPAATTLPLAGRADCLARGLQTYLDLEEVMAGELLWNFQHWLEAGGLQESIGRPKDNLYIPGQSNYNDFALIKRQVVVVAKNVGRHLAPYPAPEVLLSSVAALGAGSGVNVVCDSALAHERWSKIRQHLMAAGLPRKNLQCHWAAPGQLQQMLGHPKVAAYLFDGNLADMQQLAPMLYGGKFPVEHVKRICHPTSDGPASASGPRRFADYVLQFIEPRAFAVNTMRYGAPLELNHLH